MRRRMLVFVSLAAIGAIVNVVVALGCVLMARPGYLYAIVSTSGTTAPIIWLDGSVETIAL